METKLIADIVGYMAAAIGAYMFLPQAIQLWRTKETAGISLASFSLLLLSAILWTTYGILLKAIPIIFVNSVIGTLSVFIIYLKLRYK